MWDQYILKCIGGVLAVCSVRIRQAFRAIDTRLVMYTLKLGCILVQCPGHSFLCLWHVLLFAEDPTLPSKTNEWLAAQGVDAATCRAILNPGFADPWHPRCGNFASRS